MIRATDIHSVTDFTRNAKAYIKQINETKNPVALTVNGSASVVVVDAEEYQAILDERESADLIAAIREGEADIAAGNRIDLDDAFAEIRGKLGL